MSVREFRTNLTFDLAFSQDIISNTVTISTYILDTADYDGGVTFTALAPIYVGGQFNIFVETSDDSGMAGATVLTAENLTNDYPVIIEATSEGNIKLGSFGVVGAKRYLRVYIESTGVSGTNRLIITASKMPELVPTI